MRKSVHVILFLLVVLVGCESGSSESAGVDALTGDDVSIGDDVFSGEADLVPVADVATGPDFVSTDSGAVDVPVVAAEPHPSCSRDVSVLDTPAEYQEFRAAGYTRYAELVVDGQVAIRFFIDTDISQAMIERAHRVAEFYLVDVPGSRFGADKSAVIQKLVEHEAVLVLPNGADGDKPEWQVLGQPLYHDEISAEGSDWYMNNDWEHRDASLEEIFHVVHVYGIGTDVPGALPDYQSELLAEAQEAITDGRWAIPIDPFVTEWIEELTAEGSLAQEYIVSVIDSYYGMWGSWDETDGGMWGIYIAKTRSEVDTLDPNGAALLRAFLPDALSYEAYIDPSFEGVFSLAFDPAAPYTHKSQYLRDARLSGTNAAGLLGNAEANTLRGNEGDNTLDGAAGEDTVVYCRHRAHYTVQREGDEILVSGPDGVDVLRRVEYLHFTDAVVQAAGIE